MRAANRIFICACAAIVCHLPFGSSSLTTGLATFEPMKGVLTLLNEETFTLASSQYASTHDLRKSDMSYSIVDFFGHTTGRFIAYSFWSFELRNFNFFLSRGLVSH